MINRFDEIHALLRKNDVESVIDELLNYDSGRIKRPYNEDLNHAWYVVGDAYFKVGDYSQALRAFKSSLRNRKNDYEAMHAIADCYSELAKPRMAKVYLEKAIKVCRGVGMQYDALTYDLGNAYFDMRKFDMAAKEYGKVTETNEDIYEMAQENLELAKSKLKRTRKK